MWRLCEIIVWKFDFIGENPYYLAVNYNSSLTLTETKVLKKELI